MDSAPMEGTTTKTKVTKVEIGKRLSMPPGNRVQDEPDYGTPQKSKLELPKFHPKHKRNSKSKIKKALYRYKAKKEIKKVKKERKK